MDTPREQIGLLRILPGTHGGGIIDVRGMQGTEDEPYTLDRLKEDIDDLGGDGEQLYVMVLWDNGQLCFYDPDAVLLPPSEGGDADLQQSLRYHAAWRNTI